MQSGNSKRTAALHRALKKSYKIWKILLSRSGILIHRANRPKTATVALARVGRFEFRFLSRRNEMRVLFQIFDDLFGDHFPLEAAQRVLDRFIRVDCYKGHLP